MKYVIYIPIDRVKSFCLVVSYFGKVLVEMRLPLPSCDAFPNEGVHIIFDVWEKNVQAPQYLLYIPLSTSAVQVAYITFKRLTEM